MGPAHRDVSTNAPGAALAIPLDEGLATDPRFLADGRLLVALHGELVARLGEGEAARALLQAGFLHGLRGALRLRSGASPAELEAGTGGGSGPLVPMRFSPGAGAAGSLHGGWPAHAEAEAVLVARGRSAGPACRLSVGYTSGWLSGLWDADVLVVERHCAAHGDHACAFEAREAADWEGTDDPVAHALLAELPFAALREAVGRELRSDAPESLDSGAFDPESPAVHVWGPVMVVPYAGDETAVAVEAVARDSAAAGVTVVVVDLQGAVVDDGFGAVALERVVDAIAAQGAEAVIAGISPLSERVVAGLASAPLVVRKDLRAAIATAFQIAEAQRRVV